MIENKIWLSFHLFYTDLDFLLRKGISPFIDALKKHKLIQQYFFIRYNEKGRHIRLRLLVEQKKSEQIELQAMSHFVDFFKQYPSVERRVESEDFFPNNSIQNCRYIPEVQRYGGEEAMVVSESHFHDSSVVVLDLLNSYDDWTLSLAQGKAIELYITFLKAVGLSRDSKLRMLTIMNDSQWKDAAQRVVGSQDVNIIFEKNYDKNKDQLMQYVQNLNDILEHDIESIPYLSEFYHKVSSTDQSLKNVIVNKLLLSGYTASSEDIENWKGAIYTNYLHMLNNRLDLKNHDEAYLSFLLLKIIKDNHM